MSTKRWSVIFLIVVGGLSISPTSRAASDDAPQSPDVRQLIQQLGDDEYLVRERAETQLLERGAAAFAELQSAEKHADLEVATRARYILNQISIEWVRPTDSAAVQSIMGRYGELSTKLKLTKIRELSKLPKHEGFGALCRIACFDSVGIVARYAALAILDEGLLPKAEAPQAIAALREELGEGDEAPGSWVDLYADQLQSPDEVDPRWLELIDEEIDTLAEADGATDESLTLSLLRTLQNLCGTLSDDETMIASWERQIELGVANGNMLTAELIDAIAWLVGREYWDALELLEDRYARELKADRLLLYHVALAREQAGRADAAATIAEQALALEDDDLERRNSCAELVAARGHHDWAEREWAAVVERAEPTDLQSLLARQSLGMFCLNDRLEHKAAADLLTETIDAIEADEEIEARYQGDDTLRDYYSQFRSNRDFFLASHFASIGDYDNERKYLEQAYELEPDNADLLIAMFQSKEADAAYRRKARKRVSDAQNKLEKEVAQVVRMKRRSPELNRYLAHKYNHWAWLVSNTEGDFDKAVKYSRQSLKLQPGSPSYLDTLGRCYYAAGDLENALEVQREAVSKQPHLMVMQRQLQLFEEALEKRETKK